MRMNQRKAQKNHSVKIMHVWIRGGFLLHNQGEKVEIVYTLDAEAGVGMSRHLD